APFGKRAAPITPIPTGAEGEGSPARRPSAPCIWKTRFPVQFPLVPIPVTVRPDDEFDRLFSLGWFNRRKPIDQRPANARNPVFGRAACCPDQTERQPASS